jgi:nucleotide-binding universal stress UspA family protein
MKTLVTLASYKHSKTAYFLKENLEHENIDCFFAFTSRAQKRPEEVKVQVKAEDVERAIRVMMDIKDKYGKEIESLEPEHHVRKIIVPTDFSQGSENACYYAVHLANKLQAEIKLLHVFESPIGEVHVKETATFEAYSANLYTEAEKRARSEIVAVTQRVNDYMQAQGIKGVKVHAATVIGNIIWRIKNISSQYNPDFVVLGSVGWKKSSESVLSGVANEIIRGLRIPVFAVPGPIKEQDFEKLNILYATDFNEKDYNSLDQMLEILEPFRKKVTCIHIDTEQNPAKEERMDELNDFLCREYIEHEISCQLIEDDDVYGGIKDFADRNSINLLSFTTQKHSIFEKLFKPNLFNKILQEANLPILIFPS